MRTLADAEEQALRDACDRGDFRTAEVSAARFTTLLRAEVAELPPGQSEQRLQHACDTLESCRRTLCAVRAHLGEELHRLDKLSSYHARLIEA